MYFQCYKWVFIQNLITLLKLAEQKKNQRAPNFKNRISKETHDIKIAEHL